LKCRGDKDYGQRNAHSSKEHQSERGRPIDGGRHYGPRTVQCDRTVERLGFHQSNDEYVSPLRRPRRRSGRHDESNTGCGEVFLTTDFIHWRNITPPLKIPKSVAKGQCLYVWSDASFTSPTVGWLLARNGGSTQTILRHTVDGGRSWITQPGGDTGAMPG